MLKPNRDRDPYRWKVAVEGTGLSPNQVAALALVVNELATNAIKHAYEEGKSGQITITVGRNASNDVTVVVNDEGLPFPDLRYSAGDGLEPGLASD
jgi:two-component sensor histidine kinase